MLPAERDGQPDPEPVLVGHVPMQEQGLVGLVEDYEARATWGDKIPSDRTYNAAVSSGHDGLQVDKSDLYSDRTAPDDQVGTAVAVSSQDEKEVTTSLNPTSKPRHRRRLIIVAITIILVITAAVLGGVLGSRAVDGSASSSPSTSDTPSTPIPTDTGTSTPNLIRPRSSLSVTAWREGQVLQIFLYYQSIDGTLRWSTYDDTRFTHNGLYWGESMELGMDSEADPAANGTSLAATTVLWGTQYKPQIDLVYLNPNAGLRTIWTSNNDPQHRPWKGFNDLEYTAATGSYLTAYWPYFARVNADGVLAMWRNQPASDTEYSQTENWVSWNVSTVMAGSKLAIVPLGSNITTLAWWANYGLFFQDTEGKLGFAQPYRGEAARNNTLVDSWPSEAVFPSISLPTGGSFAAFTTARPDDREGLVNTYVLYQEASSRISMVYLDNKSEWATSQPETLSIADNGTDISCLTMPMTQRDINGNDLDLETVSSRVNRCYFQRGGHVIEVALTGTDWIELATIPID